MKDKTCLICKNKTFLLKENINYVPAEHKSFFAKHKFKYGILKCLSCGLEFQDPMPTEEVLKELYGKSYVNPRASEEIAVLNSKKNIKLLVKYGLTNKSKLLDFGCGDNHFVKMGKSNNWIGYDKYSMPAKLDNDYNFVTLWGVLEHLTDPVKTLKEARGLLRGGGQSSDYNCFL